MLREVFHSFLSNFPFKPTFRDLVLIENLWTGLFSAIHIELCGLTFMNLNVDE